MILSNMYTSFVYGLSKSEHRARLVNTTTNRVWGIPAVITENSGLSVIWAAIQVFFSGSVD